MSNRQAEIAQALAVIPPFADTQAMAAEIARRVDFIAHTLQESGLKP